MISTVRTQIATKIADNREFFFISTPLMGAFLLACGLAITR
ncbi:hypothetical protein [Terriglobus saanensis]|uniref:Uncharacterized protein n=1 Tax=Terriglobus saanensis (strain ATCC BAA-1853 / DSM 23119 / SP1PR4) TaxID=401053 RepID=E8V0D9_TERSS|nr:hypothetical protein [Terriglobus saanensis]ADV84422.1 hypothetical protein AciPR4_3670 [Terriglobus saanensis SP1PR4]